MFAVKITEEQDIQMKKIYETPIAEIVYAEDELLCGVSFTPEDDDEEHKEVSAKSSSWYDDNDFDEESSSDASGW